MCFVPKLNTKRLASVLEEYLRKENGEVLDERRFYRTLKSQGSEITPLLLDKTVRWIWLLNQDFEYLPDTFSLTVKILNRFLTLIKTKPRYLRCIAITCYFLAIKTLEEDESIPSLSELVRVSECGCSDTDVLRMERIILNKLEWNLNTVTPLQFLYLYNALVFSDDCPTPGNMAPPQHVHMMRVKLEDCLCNSKFTQFKSSVLGLAIFSQEMESLSPSGWLAVVIKLQKLTCADFGELIRCRELLHDTFGNDNQINTVRSARNMKPFYQQSLATIPEEPSITLQERLQVERQASIEVDSNRSMCEPVVFRDELKRLSSMADSLLSDEDSTPMAKRRRAEKPLTCGLQSQRACGICTNEVQAIQAIAL